MGAVIFAPEWIVNFRYSKLKSPQMYTTYEIVKREKHQKNVLHRVLP